MRTLVSAAALCAALLCGSATAQTKANPWWDDDGRPPQPFTSPNAKKLPLISVRGNRFVDPEGKPVLFRGLAIADPDKIEEQGRWNRELFVKVRETGARVVRIPVHPVAWRERTPAAYLALLDQAVEWCAELGMYVMIDWHSIGNLKAGLFQNPMYDTSLQETAAFWRAIARRYRGDNTVAFYELFNEPTLFRDQLGRMSWDDWKKINEDLIALIRSYDLETIPLVAGFDWAYDLSPLRINPIEADGIGYVTHPYAFKRTKPWEPKWEENFGFAADQFPLIATEFGFGPGQAADYGKAIVAYLERRGIGWVCWVFDPDWGPSLLKSWDGFPLTESGEFFQNAMQGKLP